MKTVCDLISILFIDMIYLTSSRLPERHAECKIVLFKTKDIKNIIKILKIKKFHSKIIEILLKKTYIEMSNPSMSI